MFKWKASLIFAVIAALVVALAGLMKDVRFITIALRSVVGFLVAGVLACLVIFLLETKGIVSFEAMAESSDNPEGADDEGETASAEEAAGAENEQGESEEQGDLQENHEEPEGFQPLDAQSLKHMEAPPES